MVSVMARVLKWRRGVEWGKEGWGETCTGSQRMGVDDGETPGQEKAV
jgi:hypothetical protein